MTTYIRKLLLFWCALLLLTLIILFQQPFGSGKWWLSVGALIGQAILYSLDAWRSILAERATKRHE